MDRIASEVPSARGTSGTRSGFARRAAALVGTAPGVRPTARAGITARTALATLAALAALAACANDPGTGRIDDVLFSPEGNNLWAYRHDAPFEAQKVIAANHRFDGAPEGPGGSNGDPDGWDINGQICFFRHGGKTFMVTGEDTHQPNPPAGWGIFRLDGHGVGDFSAERVGRLVPNYQDTTDQPDPFGCGVLSDGRIVTTDIGNNADGGATGQLIVWFPPFDRDEVPFCKVDVTIATAQQIWVAPDDTVYVTSPRPVADPDAAGSGVFRYSGILPTSPDAAGGCGRRDAGGAPLADRVVRERVLAGGANGLATPSGIVGGDDGHAFVSSVITGVINEYDADWNYLRTVLAPPAGESIGATTFSTGTPLGLARGSDGTLYYADIGIVFRNGGFGPGQKNGSVRRIRFDADGRAAPPETIAAGLQFPDCLGIWPLRD